MTLPAHINTHKLVLYLITKIFKNYDTSTYTYLHIKIHFLYLSENFFKNYDTHNTYYT